VSTNPPRRRRRSGIALVLAGLVSAAAAVGTWQAPSASAVEFSSFDFRSNANGFTFFNDDASGARQGEGTVPHTEANLQNGPVGSGLSTVFWPGPLAANGGTLLLVLQPGCTATAPVGLGSGSTPLCPLPDSAKQLNYPLRASARSGENPPTNSLSSPGAELTTTAEAKKVTADAVVAQPISATGAFGTTQSHSKVEQTDDGGLAEASAKVQDVNLGGVIKIDQVVSTAKATTNGSKADGATSTQVSGMTVGGQPAYVDEKGLHIGEQNQPANAVANQIAQQALSEGGFKIFVSTPTKEVEGASANVTAGSLIILQESDSGTTGYILGGAHAQVTAVPGDPSLLAGGDLGSTGGFDTGSGTGSLGDLGSPTGDLGGSGTGSGGGAPSGGNGQVALGPAQNTGSTGEALKPAPVIFALLAAFALAAGMRRLSDTVLAEQVTATTCSLEGDG
jgi:hypothetical protein